MFKKASRKYVLTEEQRRMYAAEKLINFRWISKILATRSKYILSDKDLVPVSLNVELAELGQFSEVAYSAVPMEFISQHLAILLERDFPLEGYNALEGSILVSPFKGRTASLPGYVVYRPTTKQLIVAISGTSSLKLAYHDLRTLKHRHPSGRGHVHSGFWDLYKGVKAPILEGIRKGLQEHEVNELVITGHSMGGSISYLLCMDLLASNNVHDIVLLPRLSLKIVVFGAPRTGSPQLVAYWQELVAEHRKTHGHSVMIEYSVKAFRDGVPALPPAGFGFRHFARHPMYLERGRTYQVPEAESEHALFTVSPPNQNELSVLDFPRGGHNYYNGRDLERFSRRIAWLERAQPDRDGWEERYREIADKHYS